MRDKAQRGGGAPWVWAAWFALLACIGCAVALSVQTPEEGVLDGCGGGLSIFPEEGIRRPRRLSFNPGVQPNLVSVAECPL